MIWTPRAQQFAGMLSVGWPRLGSNHLRRERRCLSEDLATASVDVQGGPHLAEPIGEELRIGPRRALFGRPSVQPVEPPPCDISRSGFRHQFIEGSYQHIIPSPVIAA